jgi:hypothetical protein
LHRIGLRSRQTYKRLRDSESSVSTTVGRRLRIALRAILIGLLVCLAASRESLADTNNVRIWLDIPAQPLADALVTFSATTGLEVFYDGALSVGRRSSAVTGELVPLEGLRLLLRGTSYVAHATDDSRGMTISVAPERAASDTMRRYEPYFAILQAGLSEALCGLDEQSAVHHRIVLNLWLESSGRISRSDVFGLAEHPERRDAISNALRRVRIQQPVPLGLPQPVTMAIFPAVAGEAGGCRDKARRGPADNVSAHRVPTATTIRGAYADEMAR